jgi:hypothetical protein
MGRYQTTKGLLSDVLQFLRCCGNGSQDLAIGADHVLQPLNLFNPRNQTSVEQLTEQSEAARLKLYCKLGILQEFALTQSTGLTTALKWPCGAAKFRVIQRHNGNILIVSDGLSDPFDDLQSEANVNGFGLEFYIETPAGEIGPSAAEIKASWQFQLLFTVCSLAAGHGGIRHIIDDMQLLSTEAEGVAESIPSEHRQMHVNGSGRVGALLGLNDVDSASLGCRLTFLWWIEVFDFLKSPYTHPFLIACRHS